MHKDRRYYVYIMASQSGTLYIGVTNDLERRVLEHKNSLFKGFTKKYSCHKLIYYEQGSDVETMISREKQLKKWSRPKKIKLIEGLNPSWRDLSASLEMTDGPA